MRKLMAPKLKLKLRGRWKPLLVPGKYGGYINDHTIFQDGNLKWRLIGTGGANYRLFNERYFIEGISETLSNFAENRKLFEKTPHSGLKIAPFVFRGKELHLFFGPGNIHHFTSTDGVNWNYRGIVVKGAVFLRDPCVIKVDRQYLMYLTEFGNKVAVFTSKNLCDWRKRGTALKLGRGVPRSINSACESPFVFRQDNRFIMLATIAPAPFGRKKHYLNTIALISEDPYDFGVYRQDRHNTSAMIGLIRAHAPEVIVHKGKMYLTTCGWKGFPKPKGVGEGVWIREMKIICP